jgi:hypothetical protein
VRHHQGGAVHLRHHFRHGVGFSRPGDAEEHLEPIAPIQAFDQLGHGTHLVAGHLEVADQLERVLT